MFFELVSYITGLCMLLLLPACTCIYVLNLVSMLFGTTIPISLNISMEMFLHFSNIRGIFVEKLDFNKLNNNAETTAYYVLESEL